MIIFRSLSLSAFALAALVGCSHAVDAGPVVAAPEAKPEESPTRTPKETSSDVKTQSARTKLEHIRAHLDKNHDGVLEVSELGSDPQLGWLANADKDHDGKLGIDEMLDAATGERERLFTEVDANADGVLDASELGADWQSLKMADSDGSNSVSLRELINGQGPNGVKHLIPHLRHAAGKGPLPEPG